MDIHESNTRAELASELANYQDELAKLRLQTNRTNDARSTIFNAASRSSSGLYRNLYCLVMLLQKFPNTFHFALYSCL